jgi:hypothetical protein
MLGRGSPAQQYSRSSAMLGKHGDADAGRDVDHLVGNHESRFARLLNLPGELRGRRQVSRAPGQDRELVPTQSRDHVSLAQYGNQPLGDLLEHQVALIVVERVIDLLEPIQIHHHDRPRLVVPFARRERLQPALAEQRAIRQARQIVVQRVALKALGVRLTLGDVAHERERQTAAAQRDHPMLDVHCEGRAIVTATQGLDRPILRAWAHRQSGPAGQIGELSPPRRRDHQRQRLADHILLAIPEQQSGRRVERLDQPALADGHDPVGHAVKHRLRAGLTVTQRRVQCRDRIQ